MVSSVQSRWVSERPSADPEGRRGMRGLRGLPASARAFVGLFLCLIGLAYAAFLVQISLDTEMRVGLIAEAYRDMGAQEFVAHFFRYLTWFLIAFAPAVGVFLFTLHSERLKLFFAVWTPAWIVADLFSTWMIRFSDVFAYLLFVSGFCLAATFLVLFAWIQRELWS